MALLSLVLYPDSPLKDVAEPYTDFGPPALKLFDDMLDTMYAYDGVGLAGPQIGLSKRIFVAHPPDEDPFCLINPEIYEKEGSEAGEEGCLSLPEIFGEVSRATRIRVRGFDPHGEKVDWEVLDYPARIIQHECDHLEGVVFLDRLDILSRQARLSEWEEVRSRIFASIKRD